MGSDSRMPSVTSARSPVHSGGRAVLRNQRATKIPQRLDPDLAVGVDLREAEDLREVAIGVAAVRARGDDDPHRAVERLLADLLVLVAAREKLAGSGGVDFEARAARKSSAYQSLQRPPPSRRIARPSRAPKPLVRSNQAARQPMRVLVVDDEGVVGTVDVMGSGVATPRSRGTSPSGPEIRPGARSWMHCSCAHSWGRRCRHRWWSHHRPGAERGQRPRSCRKPRQSRCRERRAGGRERFTK